MAAAARNPKFAKKAKIPQSVAKKYNRADMTAVLSSNGKKGGYAG